MAPPPRRPGGRVKLRNEERRVRSEFVDPTHTLVVGVGSTNSRRNRSSEIPEMTREPLGGGGQEVEHAGALLPASLILGF